MDIISFTTSNNMKLTISFNSIHILRQKLTQEIDDIILIEIITAITINLNRYNSEYYLFNINTNCFNFVLIENKKILTTNDNKYDNVIGIPITVFVISMILYVFSMILYVI